MQNSTANHAPVNTTPNVLALKATFPFEFDLSVFIEEILFLDTDRHAFRCGKLIFALYSDALRYAANRRAKLARLAPAEDPQAARERADYNRAYRICTMGRARSTCKGFGR